METEEIKAEFTIHADNWNTIGLVQKVINEGKRAKIPIRIEIKSGSYESIVQVASQLATIANFMTTIAIYLATKRKEKKPVKMIQISRGAAYAVAWDHLRNSVKVKSVKLVKEWQNDSEDYHFTFLDVSGYSHLYKISKNLEINYDCRPKY